MTRDVPTRMPPAVRRRKLLGGDGQWAGARQDTTAGSWRTRGFPRRTGEFLPMSACHATWDAAPRTSCVGGDRGGPGEPCGPCGALERVALEDGGVRLDRVRRRSRSSSVAPSARSADEGLGDRERGVAARRADPRPGELQDPRARERAGAVAVGDRSTSRCSRRRSAASSRRSPSSPTLPAIVSPIDHPNAGLISRDRHSVLVQFDVKGKADQAKDKIAPILAAIDGVQSGASRA